MSHHGPDDATCTVRAFKAGLLAAAGHDLEFRLTRFSVEVEDDRIVGDFDASSLVVVGALVDGRVAPGKLSPKDERDILDNIRKSVFNGHRAEAIHFEASELDRDEDEVSGEGVLTIPPYSQPLSFLARVEEGRVVCELVLHQPDWGITPFKAPLGVLRIKPDLLVRIGLPWTD